MALFYPSERYRVALQTKVGANAPGRISELEEIVYNTKKGQPGPTGGRRRAEQIAYYKKNSGNPVAGVDDKMSDAELRFANTQDTNLPTGLKRDDQAIRTFNNEGTYP